MSDLYSSERVPTWRIVMYGFLAAAGVATLGYFQHDHGLYTFAVFCGILCGGGGFLMSWIRSQAEPGQPVKTLRIPVSTQIKAVKLIQILALPTALMACLTFQDSFLAPPEQDVARITCKDYTYGGGKRRRPTYWIEARGHVLYHKSVARSFWYKCNAGDEIKLEITPRFGEWRHVSLMRNGEVVAESGLDFFRIGVNISVLFFPCIFFLPSVNKPLPNPCSGVPIKFVVFCACLFIEAFTLFAWADNLLRTFGVVT